MQYKLFKGIFFSVALIAGSVANAHEVHHLNATMMLEHEGFMVWYAVKEGWDKEIGLEIDLSIVHTSGIDVIDKKRQEPKAWDVAGVGAIPAIAGSENLPIEIIGIANDEAEATDVVVPKDSEILKTKGWNEDFPEVYGDPESIKGKKFYTKRLTSSSYTFSNWLDIFDLNEQDVTTVNTTAYDAVARMTKNDGAGAVIWSPNNFMPLDSGFKIAASAKQIGLFLPIAFVSDLDYAESHPRRLGKFLALYERVAKEQQKNPEKMAKEYQAFIKQFLHQDIPLEVCLLDLKKHPTYTVDEQIKMFDRSRHSASPMMLLEKKIIAKLIWLSINKKHPVNYNSKTFVRVPTDKYLRIAKEYVDNNYQQLPGNI